MITANDIKFFQRKGYLIKKTSDLASLNKIQDFVYNCLSIDKKIKKSKTEYFENLHKYINKKKLNK